MPEVLHVAVAQSPAELSTSQDRLSWLMRTLEQHADQSCDLIILPELFQSGYYVGDKVADYAEPSNGPFAKSMAELANTYSTAILYGYSERQDNILYNSAQCLNKKGQVIGHHRKLLLPPGFEGNHFIPGDGCQVFELQGFKIGILICYDIEFPENVRHVALQGAELVAAPTALGAQWGVVSEKVVPTRAFENGVYVCYSNYCGHENGMKFFGGSCIVAPDGSDLERAGQTPAFLHSCIGKSDVAAAQDRLPYHKDVQKLPWF